jgi:hypothetical protein
MIKLEYGFRGDPRMRLVRCGMPMIEKVVDDGGKVLYAAEAKAARSFGPVEPAMQEINTMMPFPAPEGKGRKVTISGRMEVVEALERERAVIAEVTTQASAPVSVGGMAWKLWAADARGGKWVVNGETSGTGQTEVPVWVRVEDAAGKVVWDGQAKGRFSVTVQAGEVQRPLRATLTGATKAGSKWVLFEFKDVALPGGAGMPLPAELGLPEGR